MKKLLFVSIALGLFGYFAACSQSDTKPPFIGDCDGNCGNPNIPPGGGDASTDATTKPDAKTDSGSDATIDADASADALDDGLLGDALPDVNVPDVLNLDGAGE